MTQASLILGYVFVVMAIILILIATAIAGIISTRYDKSDTRSRLRASTAISGLTALFAIATAVVGILFARAKSQGGKQMKALGIIFLILGIITLLMYATVLGLNLSVRARDDISQTDKNALLATVFIIAAGFISLTIATILFFVMTKGKSGKEALDSLKFQRRTRTVESSPMGTSVTDTVQTKKVMP